MSGIEFGGASGMEGWVGRPSEGGGGRRGLKGGKGAVR